MSSGGGAAKRRVKEVLYNPTWEQIVERKPLTAFSWYLSGRVNVLLFISDEIIENLDRGFAGPVVDGGSVERAETLMWLWTLGAYEVVRTICQAKGCFSDRAAADFAKIKGALAAVRMPAAKMEKAGKKEPVTSNRSPSGWDVERRDLLINDPHNVDVSARWLLSEFERVISSLKAGDMLGRHEAAYPGWREFDLQGGVADEH